MSKDSESPIEMGLRNFEAAIEIKGPHGTTSQINALYDSGCATSFVSTRFVQRAGLEVLALADPPHFGTFPGSRIVPEGWTTFEFSLEGQLPRQYVVGEFFVHILPNTVGDVILGRDIIEKLRLSTVSLAVLRQATLLNEGKNDGKLSSPDQQDSVDTLLTLSPTWISAEHPDQDAPARSNWARGITEPTLTSPASESDVSESISSNRAPVIIEPTPTALVSESDISDSISSDRARVIIKPIPTAPASESNISDSISFDGARVMIKPTPTAPASESDVSDSISSDGRESIFSFADSVSSESSFGSTEGSDMALGQLIQLLSEETPLIDLYREAVGTHHMGRDRFQRNLLRALRMFGLELTNEARKPEQKQAAKYIRRWSWKASEGICSRGDTYLEPDSEREYTQDSGSGNLRKYTEEDEVGIQEEEDGSPDEALENVEMNFEIEKAFILSSIAFQELQEKLERFVHPTFAQRLNAIAMRYVGKLSEREKVEHESLIRRLVSDLCDSNPDYIHISDYNRSGWFNTFQCNIERWTGETWHWEPFTAPLYPLVDKRKRVRWICSCGDEKWAHVPKLFGDALDRLLRAHASVNTSGSKAAAPEPSVSGKDTESRKMPPKEKTQLPLPLPPPGADQAADIEAGWTSHDRSEAAASSDPGRILLVVESAGDYSLAQIQVEGLNTNQFFRELRKEYFGRRGIWRNLFSFWRFSHCDFYRFEKFGVCSHTPQKKNDFPDIGDKDYRYDPRPPRHIPPITDHEFKKRFDTCGLTNSANSFVHRLMDKRSRRGHFGEKIQAIPKKVTHLDESSDEVESYWTLYARQRIRFLGVIVWSLACVSPMIWFFFMWLFKWGKGGELPAASVPLSLTLTLLSIYLPLMISSVFSGRDKDE